MQETGGAEDMNKKNEKWYLLFEGSSPDGRGDPNYKGRTKSATKAKEHFDKCANNPYSTGKVVIVTDHDYEIAWHNTKWD